MTEYIRGIRQFKAILYFIEQIWLVLIGRDARGMDKWEKQFSVWCGMEYRRHRFRCAIRELEIITGFAKSYKIVFAPSFWESLRRIGIHEEIIEEFRKKY